MTWFTTTVASTLALSGMCSAHMILANPKPYGDPDNSPLTSSNYPCQVSGDASTFYSTDGLSNTVAAGESLTMSFTGSAVHGGGSCQVALTTDMQPSKTTRWSVILSIEGGCPTKDGTTASTYDVKIPSDIPAGTYSYAWTWTSKLSGTQEYYMNCAPLTVTSGSSKRSTDISPRSDSLDNYPPLAVYNLADLNSCKSELSSSPLYPYPGSTVEHLAEGEPAYANITGTDCFATGVTYDGSSSGSTSSTTSNSGSSSDSSSSGSETTSQAVEATTAAATAAAATSSASGFLTSVVAATTQAATSAAAAAATAAASGSGSSSSSSSSSGSSSGSCTTGDYQCLSGGKTYKMCVAGGTWSTTMSVADGTACTPGTDSTLSLTVTSTRKQKRRNGMPLLSFR
ncbi:hypothetical protein SLS53_003494 [Cytospora paraplurivora]|uniref:Lytic polysaccharide monooxygenase n=1 Tax=Cytospora paraplurivora TaxID=2898453 RepID=A0AAN9UJK9_9PEZI